MASSYLSIPTSVVKRAWAEAPVGTSYPKSDYPYSFRVTKKGTKKGSIMVITRLPAGGMQHFGIIAFPRPNDSPHFVRGQKALRSGGPWVYNPDAIGTFEVRQAKPGAPIKLLVAQAHFRSRSVRKQGPPPGITEGEARAFSDTLETAYTPVPEAIRRIEQKNSIFSRFELKKLKRQLGDYTRYLRIADNAVPRSVASKYEGWWYHAMNELVDYALESGVDIHVPKSSLRREKPEWASQQSASGLKRLVQVMDKVCEERGIACKKRALGGFIIKTGRKPGAPSVSRMPKL